MGKPAATNFIWYVNDTRIKSLATNTWHLDPGILGSQANLSCQVKFESHSYVHMIISGYMDTT